MSRMINRPGKSRASSLYEMLVRRTGYEPVTIALENNSRIFVSAIVFSLTLLVACGGGGSSGTALQPLPTAINAGSARMVVDGSLPPDMTTTEIERALQSMSVTADTLLISDIVSLSGVRANGGVSCTGRACTGSVNSDTIRFSLDDFDGNLGVNNEVLDADNRSLAGYNEEYRLVMTDEGVTLGQKRSAGWMGNESFQFQSYGGWIENNVFAVQYETATGGAETLTWLTSYSFGKESGLNPTGNVAAITWEGVMVGMNTETGHFVHGDAGIVYVIGVNTLNALFSDIKNLSDGSDVGRVVFQSVMPTNGNFESANGEIKGSFYGTNHEEVGGVFNKDNIIGAFGAMR